MSNFAEEMAQYEEMYAGVEAAVGPALFTDGAHQAIISVARVEETDRGWRWTLVFRGIDTYTRKPARITKWTTLPPEDAQRAEYLKADRARLGEEGSIADLKTACEREQFIGLVCNIGVKTKTGQDRDFTNVYINGVFEKHDVEQWMASRQTAGVDGPTGDNLDAPVAAGVDDDIPF